MGSDPDKSLSDEATFAGAAKRRPASEVSIGDERTLGDNRSGRDTIIDDSEVVDLDARYRVEGTLGQGGMGAVLLATDTRLDRKVAIKRILGEAAGNRMAVQRFLTEAKSIAALNHPNIVQIYDYGRAKDGPFLIMEYVDGGSLLDRCRESAMPLEAAVDLTCQLCDGLAKAHDLGIIHRDIKPANVLLTKDGTPKLTDFGLAKAEASDHGQTMTGAVLGTPDFMPPEQRKDTALVDHRSDLWSLAATVYQMVTGRSPKIIRFDLLPAELTTVLGKSLEDAKEDRYQSAKEFRDAIRRIRFFGRRQAAPAHFEGVLQEGQCKACGTVTSDLTKKFCRNPQCGASLRVACLKCEAPIPVWDGVCGECGGNQPALLAAKRESLAAAREEAEALLAAMAFDQAIARATTLASETHPDLAEYTVWGASFVESANSEKDRQEAAAAEKLREAKRHRETWDYSSAIHALETIAAPLRNSEATAFLKECNQQKEEADSLIGSIAARIKRQELEGLLPVVERAVDLRGDRQDLVKIRAQLVERREGRLARAKAALATGDVKTAAAALSKAVPDDYPPDGQMLISDVRRALELEAEIIRLVREAKADSKITSKEAAGILRVGEVYLALNPAGTQIKQIVEQSRQRIAECALTHPQMRKKCRACGSIYPCSYTLEEHANREYCDGPLQFYCETCRMFVPDGECEACERKIQAAKARRREI